MRNPIILFIVFTLISFHRTQAQELIHSISSCAYGSSSAAGQYYSFESDEAANKIMARILEVAPEFNIHKHPFELRAGGRISVAEVITTRDHKKIILYSQYLLNKLNQDTETNWAAVSILAHELGHIVYGHQYHRLDREHNHRNELVADRYSGIILALLGANEKDTRLALQVAGNTRSTESHPHPDDRLAAITNGWTKGKNSKTSPAKVHRPRLTNASTSNTRVKKPSLHSAAPKLEITEVRRELNAYKNGVRGIKLYVDFKQERLNEKRINVVAYFEYTNGTKLRDFNGKYLTKGGNVSASASVTPKYASSTYSNVEIFIPIDELHLKSGRVHHLSMNLQIHSGSNKSKFHHVTNLKVTID